MLIEFDGGWQLWAHQDNLLGESFKCWFSINHIHITHNTSGNYTKVNAMNYTENNRCPECGSAMPEEIEGTINLINWSMGHLKDDNHAPRV